MLGLVWNARFEKTRVNLFAGSEFAVEFCFSVHKLLVVFLLKLGVCRHCGPHGTDCTIYHQMAPHVDRSYGNG